MAHGSQIMIYAQFKGVEAEFFSIWCVGDVLWIGDFSCLQGKSNPPFFA